MSFKMWKRCWAGRLLHVMHMSNKSVMLRRRGHSLEHAEDALAVLSILLFFLSLPSLQPVDDSHIPAVHTPPVRAMLLIVLLVLWLVGHYTFLSCHECACRSKLEGAMTMLGNWHHVLLPCLCLFYSSLSPTPPHLIVFAITFRFQLFSHFYARFHSLPMMNTALHSTHETLTSYMVCICRKLGLGKHAKLQIRESSPHYAANHRHPRRNLA